MSVRREVETARANVGVWRRGDHTVIQVGGADAGRWLQAQTTNDVLALASGEGCLNALLDRQGRVQAAFTTHRWEDEYWLVVDRAFVQPILDRVESHVFLEDVRVSDVGSEGAQVLVEGPRALVLLAHCGDAPPEEMAAAFPAALHAFAPVRLLGRDVLAFRMSESGLDGYLLLVETAEAGAFHHELVDELAGWGAVAVGEAARECLRVEGGQARAGRELTGREVINETPLLETAVSDRKGCYPGQEVVARLRAYGSPRQAMVALLMEDGAGTLPPAGTALRVDGKRAGTACSSTFSPTLGRWVGLAYLGRDWRTPGARHTFLTEGGTPFEAAVALLPVIDVSGRQTLARRRYEAALEAFEADTEDTDDTAIELLKEAVLLAPDFEDALESLGVILHRHQRVEEAIGYMQALARANPGSIMAHANLSLFYMTQGRIQDAEEEKARAAQLEQHRELDARRAARDAEQQRERLRAEARERIGMFHEVLEIDPRDPVATMGLGSAHMQLEDYAAAVPFLETAVAANPDYSAAWLNLGKCREFLGDPPGAAETYRRGIEAAGRQGDFMPLREMERRLAALKAGAGP